MPSLEKAVFWVAAGTLGERRCIEIIVDEERIFKI